MLLVSMAGRLERTINWIHNFREKGMKKIILFLAGIMTAVSLVSEVSALPLFARQTGMVCSACHFQHFPLLNGFGRAFKSTGYTMMGEQGKVEGQGLGIPKNLNMAVLATAGYEKTNQAAGTAGANTTGDGAFYVPGTGGELALFFGGHVSDNAGFLAEIGNGGAVAGTAIRGTRSSAKMPILFEVASSQYKLAEGTRVGVVPFSTDVQGASYGFEVLNTGANAVHQMSNTPGLNDAHSAALSAQQYIGTAAAATGLAFVATNPMGFINLTKYNQTGIAQGTLATLGSTYVRVAGIFDLAGWDSGVGIQSWSGSSLNPAGTPAIPGTLGTIVCNPACAGILPTAAVPATYGIVSTKASAIDAQMQGRIGDMPVGLYASYAKAPAGSANAYNLDPAAAVAGSGVTAANGTATKSSFNFSVEVGVIPEKVTLGGAYRSGKSGVAVGTFSNASDNAIMLVATYKLAQNMLASFTLTTSNGQYWDAAHQNALGSSTSTINLFTLF
jgi:hypothetical protein